MRLLLVIDHLNSGGAQRQITHLAIGLARRGHEVTIFTYAAGELLGEPVRAAGIKIETHLKPSRFSLRPVFALRKLMRNQQFDMVVSYMPTPNVYSILARYGLRKRPALVISERTSAELIHQERCRGAVDRLYALADHLVVNSHHLREYFTANFSDLAGKVSTIYNGLDIGEYCPPAVEPPSPPWKLLAVGNMWALKNWMCLAEALAVLRDRGALRPIVTWVGRRTNLTAEQSDYCRSLERLLRERNMEDQWVWLDARADVIPLLQSHHALVHPSYIEGLPNAVCEALSCGLPVLASDTLDHPRLVQQGKTGFLFDWRSPPRLADAIESFCALDGAERAAMGQAARRYAEANLSLDRMIDDYEVLFEQLSARRSAA